MKKETATFGGGCFWCTEAIFQRLKGVDSVKSGYAGGHTENPTYDQVSDGGTGHQEAIQIAFDPSVVSYEKLLEIFFKTHDPTSYDRQGSDVGPQYRSVVFYETEKQQQSAEKVIRLLEENHVFGKPIVTEIKPFTNFYEAEPYHQDFYNRNQDYPYCEVVINPKLQKLFEEFSLDIKTPEENKP